MITYNEARIEIAREILGLKKAINITLRSHIDEIEKYTIVADYLDTIEELYFEYSQVIRGMLGKKVQASTVVGT